MAYINSNVLCLTVADCKAIRKSVELLHADATRKVNKLQESKKTSRQNTALIKANGRMKILEEVYALIAEILYRDMMYK